MLHDRRTVIDKTRFVMVIDVRGLQPIFELVSESIRPGSPSVDCPVATAMYWAVRINGEIGNGGIAQLIWNLHDSYDSDVLHDALVTVGAHDAAEAVCEAFDYVAATPTRKARFFAKGPFDPAKPLRKLTERFNDLAPSVATLIGRYVGEHWETPSFQAVVEASGAGDLRQHEVTADLIWSAVDEADGDALLGFVDAGLDPDARNANGQTLIVQILSRKDKLPARVATVERLVAAGANVDAHDARHDTALTGSTLWGGEAPYLRCLLALGADVEHVGNNGRTAVFGATKRAESLRVLLDGGARLDCVASDGERPLGFVLSAYARWSSDVDNQFRLEEMAGLRESIDMLLAHGAPFSEYEVTSTSSPSRHTELSVVAGDAELLAALVASPSFQATPDIVGSGAWTALHEASRLGMAPSILALLDAGVVVDAALAVSDLERRVFAGATPLDVAADRATAELLSSRGARPGVRSSHDVYVTSRGDRPDELALLFVESGEVTRGAVEDVVAGLPTVEGLTIGKEDGEIRLFSPALLARCATSSEADDMAARAAQLGVTTDVV